MIRLDQSGPEAGGKAHQLSRLRAAGLKVPDGFCLLPDCSIQSGLQAWLQLFPGQSLAVRSSSGREDGAVQSFAGQFTTVLNVRDEAAFEHAVERVRASLRGGSVLVQPMLAARVAGVAFTTDPTIEQPAARVEATPGLGEALVSGRVRPAAWRIQEDRPELVDGEACLSDAQLMRLLASCRQAQQVLGGELDLEFAFTEDEDPWILQARPITARALTLEQLCQQQRQQLYSLVDKNGTVWSSYSVAETLPHPLPMTWAVVDRMLSLRGAYGKLYRDMGYDPDPDLGDQGVADLICGRPYINLSRQARFYFKNFPMAYPLARLKADPRLALNPTPEVDLSQARPGFWRHLPATLWKMLQANSQLGRLRRNFEASFRNQIVPNFMSQIEGLRSQPLDPLSLPQLRVRLERVIQLVVDDFAGDSLKASALALLLSQGQPPRSVKLDPEADLTRLMSQAAAGQLELERLLELIGHRGPGEMELANPRWAEAPNCSNRNWLNYDPAPRRRPDLMDRQTPGSVCEKARVTG
ncbi:MAG: PEP/pyruvate-binding domain-containing protein [Vulcanimicrobiota bacterium]